MNQDGNLYGVYTRVFNATTGKNMTSEIQVNHETDNNQQNPAICAPSDEIFAVVWQSDLQDGSGYGIYARVFDITTGNNITSEFRVNEYTNDNQVNPSICALTNDTIAIAWQSVGQDGSNNGIYARIFNATTGKNMTKEFRVNYYSTNSQSNPSICALSNDTIAIAWHGEGQGDPFGVYARIFNATDGLGLGDEFLVNHYTADNQQTPSLSALSEEKFIVSWESQYQDGSQYGVYARSCSAAKSQTLSSEFLVNHYKTDYQWDSTICALSSENFVIVWHGNGNDDPWGYGIYAAILGPASSSIVSSSGDGDDDDDDDEATTIAGYDILIIISAICLITAISVKKLKKQ
jgi:hypothetical protein